MFNKLLNFSLSSLIASLSYLRLAFAFLVFALLGCGNKVTPKEDLTVKNLLCKKSEKVFSYDEVVYYGQKGGGNLTFSDIREGVYSACMNCHMAPSNAGGFTFIDSYQGSIKTIAGKTDFFPGYFDIAEQVHQYLSHPDDNLRMPPKDRRDKNPALFIKLTNQVSGWIQAGKPNGAFSLNTDQSNNRPSAEPIKPPLNQSSELGECTPDEKNHWL